ncbi:TPA: hypothetical protein PW968_001740 [Mannheimia haemolytica]|nr:hypothetical protein [Mannheimia haemolytica]
MFKEKGYDEFVNECVRKGREEHRAGLGFTLEQSRLHIKKTIEQKSQELNEFQREVVYG